VNEVHATVLVETDPGRAFALFTDEVDRWWRRGERYGGPEVTGHRFERHVGGRFLELHGEDEAPLGHITVWDPPRRLAFTWRQSNWTPGEITEVTITFAAESGGAGGTRVTLRHRGFAQIVSQVGCEVGYAAGWRELLGWYRDSVIELTAPRAGRH
jgi:uncharacterized protein YndB with AHSA1/START domain